MRMFELHFLIHVVTPVRQSDCDAVWNNVSRATKVAMDDLFMLNILRRHLLQERLDKRGCHRIDNPDFSERFRKNESGLAVTPEENSHERLQTEELQIGPKFDAAKE